MRQKRAQFAQPQYTFHLTETRLKSNLIGSVQAHDADLNDTIHYSLTGDQAHLFEINSNGLLSLRPNVKQLNISSCQLIVQAADSLSTPPIHTQQARVNLHVAPQLVGRSLNFDTTAPTATTTAAAAAAAEGRPQIGSRSTQQQWSSFGGGGGGGLQSATRTLNTLANAEKEPVAHQRSSLATVMASLQHMVRSVNFLDMPMSSALLLSALLAFLVCLLLIVVISMSVHFYLRRSKLRQTRRRHLVAAAHLRQAHLAALHGDSSPDSAAASSMSAVARADRARYQVRPQNLNNQGQLQDAYHIGGGGSSTTSRHQQQQRRQRSTSSSSARTSSNGSSPTNSTIADAN